MKIVYSAKKSYQALKIHRGNLNAYYSVKETNLKRQFIICFQLYDIWKRQNYRDSKQISDCQGLEGEKGVTNQSTD